VPGGFIFEDDLISISHAQLFREEKDHYLGHVFVESKRHVPELADLTEQEAQAIGLYISRVAKALLQAEGMELIQATLTACHLRFRPIIMTSLAFILGVLPLALSTGAGANSQRAIGTGVMGGMITATTLAVFFVPVFFVVVRRIFKGSERQRRFDAAHGHAIGADAPAAGKEDA